nr:hypothetical protein [Tanacetum cinerariifolium]
FAGVSHSRSVAFCHAHGVLHRDLKPLNLLLYRKTLMVKICDLGLFRVEVLDFVKKLLLEMLMWPMVVDDMKRNPSPMELDRRKTEVNSGPPPKREDSSFRGPREGSCGGGTVRLQQILYYTDHHGFPFVTFINTPRAFIDLKSKELGQMGNPWEIMRNDISYLVKFYGKVVTDSDVRDDGLGSSRVLMLICLIQKQRTCAENIVACKIPGVALFAVSAEYLRKNQRCQDKAKEDNGVRSCDDGVENESEKDDVDERKENEDANEKMNETEHSESEDNHNEDDHVKEVDNVNENENKNDGNDQSVREENRKGDAASSEVVDDSQKTSKPIQRSRWCLKIPHGFPFVTFIDTPRGFTDLKSKKLSQMGNPWEIMRNNISYLVKFYGKIVTDSDARDDGLGSSRSIWMMHGISQSNGKCGYVKKLGFLMCQGSNVDMFDPKATHMCIKHCRGGSHNEKESVVGFLEAWKIPGVALFAVLVEYLRKNQRCQDKAEEDNGVKSSDDGVENESEKDDVDESKEKEDAIEKMNETEHVSEETQENDENKKSETEATQEKDGKYNEKSESEDNHNEDDHVKEVDNVNENENKSDGNDQSVREENRKGDDASSEVVDDSQKTSKPIQRSRWCLKIGNYKDDYSKDSQQEKHHDQNISWNNAPILSHAYSSFGVSPQTTFNNEKFEVGEPSNRNTFNPQVVNSILYEQEENLHQNQYRALYNASGLLNGVHLQTGYDYRIMELGEPSNRIIVNPQLEKAPIGLSLRKSTSLLNHIELTLKKQSDQQNTKLKAVSFSAISLKIGYWERISKNAGDLVVKFYYRKKKLVWEFLDGSLKKKMEIPWSQISAINAVFDDEQKGRIELELSKPPELWNECNYIAKTHTQWETTTDDFTGGQASICRRHTVLCPPGVLNEPFRNLLESDDQLRSLKQQPFPIYSPFFYHQCVHTSSSIPVLYHENHQASVVPFVPNPVQPIGSFAGHFSPDLPLTDPPALNEISGRRSHEVPRTNCIWESENCFIQDISFTPKRNDDHFRPYTEHKSPILDQQLGFRTMDIENPLEYTNGQSCFSFKPPEPYPQSYEMADMSSLEMNHMNMNELSNNANGENVCANAPIQNSERNVPPSEPAVDHGK